MVEFQPNVDIVIVAAHSIILVFKLINILSGEFVFDNKNLV